MSDNTITIKKDDLWKYSTIVLLVVLVVGGIIMFSGDRSGSGAATEPTRGDEQPSVVRASVGDSPTLGDPDAPVTIIEFHDFMCSFCARHNSDTYPQIVQQYVDEGLVRYVKKDFVTVGASEINQVAHCARDQAGDEGYFEMGELLYGSQQSIAQAPDRMEVYTQLADQMGIDSGELESCISNGDHASTVDQGRQEAVAAGGSGTPHFVIMETGESEGTALRGAQPFPTFQQAIESML
ncbi:MAG: thioredoxin domain-containing protein [Candidatus Pacearchaeota archaeon]